VFDGISNVCCGILRGVGIQKFGAFINLSGYYMVGLPIAYVLAFPPNHVIESLGVVGLWSGLLSALIFASIGLAVVVSRIGWQEEAEKAINRVEM
jgi:MATE family multidrug resistance protein